MGAAILLEFFLVGEKMRSQKLIRNCTFPRLCSCKAECISFVCSVKSLSMSCGTDKKPLTSEDGATWELIYGTQKIALALD